MTRDLEVFLKKAENALTLAERALQDGDHDGAADRAYYAAFQATLALLAGEDVLVRTHNGAFAELNRLFVQSRKLPGTVNRALMALQSRRHQADYSTEFVSERDAVKSITDARAFLDLVRPLLAPYLTDPNQPKG